jgi:hypothetical protein
MRGRASPSSPERAILAALFCAAVWAAPALAQTTDDDGLHGRLLVQDAFQATGPDSLQAASGAEDANDAIGNLRITWQPTWGPISLQVHYVISAEDGPDVELERLESRLYHAPPATWLDLTDTFENTGSLIASQTIDRLALTYTTPDLVVRVGRQALTWGSGLVFRPMDLFDPFSPTATDTEYKPGVDMLYVQRLFPDGSDLQLVIAPRPYQLGGPPSSDASSAALHFHTTLFGHETTLMMARDHGDWVAAAGVNGALAGSTWNLELVPTALRAGGVRVSALADISDAVTLFGRNATVFGEYFHNGFGVASGQLEAADLPPALVERLARGQVFNLRQDYLAAGVTLEVNPLLSLSPTLIADLDDGSVYPLIAATYSLADNVSLIAGAQVPLGRPRSEFGGVALSPQSPTLLQPPQQIYIQLRRYF